jgi:hypothetical protein
VAVDLGQVQVRDLVIIASGKDQPGVLSGSLINTGNNEQRVAFAMQTGQQVTTTAPAHSEQPLSDSTQVQLSSVPVAPGDVIKLSVQSAGAATVVVTVPVLPPSGYYATLNPTSQPSTTTTATP